MNFKKVMFVLSTFHLSKMDQMTELRREIAKRLKHARERAGYFSAQDFCNENRLPYSEYLSCESGCKPIRVSQAKIYTRLLNISLQWLLIGDR